jgi:phosphoribosylaminoimidazole-succinocarboxamide synthase
MNPPKVLFQCNFPALGKPHRGKTRDIYDLGKSLLIVATDRVSAFDVVLRNGIPHKGEILNLLSALWLQRLGHINPNHLLTTDPAKYPEQCRPYASQLLGRSTLVRKAMPLPVECIVRGYLFGSAWKLYQQDQPICDIRLPPGLKEAQKLDEPLFTPATKTETGHDRNIAFAEMEKLVGRKAAAIMKNASLRLYQEARQLAQDTGIIIADTKFEFGLAPDGRIILIDEVLTPDSSMFWPREDYEPGHSQPSFDKQSLWDWLEASGWNKQPPIPALPPEIIRVTSEKYEEFFARLSLVLIGNRPTER